MCGLNADLIEQLDALAAAGGTLAMAMAIIRVIHAQEERRTQIAAVEDEERRAAQREPNNARKRKQRGKRCPETSDIFKYNTESDFADAGIAASQTVTPPTVTPPKKEESISVKESNLDSKDKYSSSDAALCPANWQPSEEHHAAGAAKGIAREKVDQLAAEMRAWSQANKHKDFAFKADWAAAFHGWIARQKPAQKPTLTVVQGGRPRPVGEETYMDQYIRENPEAWRECQLRNGIKI